MKHRSLHRQRGGFVLGMVIGLLIGLALALGVALYITKAPIPFVNKVPQRTAEQDTAEAERNRTWDPNAPLGGRARPPVAAAPAASDAPMPPLPGMVPPGVTSAASAPAAAGIAGLPPGVTPPPAPGGTASRAGRDPAAILSGANVPGGVPGAEPFIFFVQAGAFTRSEDAEQQRARLAMIGQTARIVEREQAGRTVYRVRLGPYPTRDEADALLQRLQEQAVEAQIVRVERP